ncbi:peroxiredoxin [Candidatus Uhrbacteria bacterium]|nr:peroxiredoxin [Candidatus Uhrbacteria bacterium]
MIDQNTEDFLCCAHAQVGEQAPDFTLEGVDTDGVTFRTYPLKSHRGEWVVLFFYPLDFTFICPTEITQFSTRFADFQKLNTIVYSCSTDSVHSHKQWLKEIGPLKFPMLSDMTQEMSDAYGVLVHSKGITLRGTFIIDPEGVLRYAAYNDLDVGRSVDEVLRVLAALQTGERCPVDWKPGEQTLGK